MILGDSSLRKLSGTRGPATFHVFMRFLVYSFLSSCFSVPLSSNFYPFLFFSCTLSCFYLVSRRLGGEKRIEFFFSCRLFLFSLSFLNHALRLILLPCASVSNSSFCSSTLLVCLSEFCSRLIVSLVLRIFLPMHDVSAIVARFQVQDLISDLHISQSIEKFNLTLDQCLDCDSRGYISAQHV